MRQAVFITGFNNWGKSRIIFDLFGGQVRFSPEYNYRMQRVRFNTLFTVQSQSNDDLKGESWVEKVEERISNAPDGGNNLISALCPSMEANNNFIELLRQPIFTSYDRLHFLLIEYKWEHHAKLIVDPIITMVSTLTGSNIILINDDQSRTSDQARYDAKMGQIRRELDGIF